MATTTKTAKKTTGKKKVATKKAATKKAATKKAATKKATTRKAATRTTKEARATTLAATITEIGLSRDGAWWNITLSTKRRVRVAAGAALALRVRVGARWTKSLEARIDRLANEQRVYALALELLAKDPRITKAQLIARLGGDAGARETVRSLVSHGWL